MVQKCVNIPKELKSGGKRRGSLIEQEQEGEEEKEAEEKEEGEDGEDEQEVEAPQGEQVEGKNAGRVPIARNRSNSSSSEWSKIRG
jgi:hypothetical protein